MKTRALLPLLLLPLAVACGDVEAGTPALPSARASSASRGVAPEVRLVTPQPEAPDPAADEAADESTAPAAKPTPLAPVASRPQVAWTPPASTPQLRRSPAASGVARKRAKGTNPSAQREQEGRPPEERKTRGRPGVGSDPAGRIAGSGSTEPVQSKQVVKRKFTTPYKGRKVHNPKNGSGGGGQ